VYQFALDFVFHVVGRVQALSANFNNEKKITEKLKEILKINQKITRENYF